MAKDIYRDLSVVELNGVLDVADDGGFIVYVETGKDSPVMQVELNDVLNDCCGRQISLKLTREKVL